MQKQFVVEWPDNWGIDGITAGKLASIIGLSNPQEGITVVDITAKHDRLEISYKFLADIWMELLSDAFDYLLDAGVIGAVATKLKK